MNQKNSKVCQQSLHFLLHHYLQNIKRSIFAFFFCLPTSLLALLLFLLLVYNGFSVFCVHLPLPAKSSPEPANIVPAGETFGDSTKTKTSIMYVVEEENPPVILKTHIPLLRQTGDLKVPKSNNSSWFTRSKKIRKRKIMSKILQFGDKSGEFQTRVWKFFKKSSCQVRFFMTWISPLSSFGRREIFAIESLFKSHPNSCLVIVSSSLDSPKGNQFLSPFLKLGLKLISLNPDFHYIFKGTYAETWFNNLKNGNLDPGEVSLGQNLSNLIRLSLLYKFGGIYIDADVILLKSLANLRNSIGAQTIDAESGQWSRLNNAVLIFDKHHPLLYKFIEEFALTFNGNKWGHNGPYLVSRVVKRIDTRPGFNFTVLPPMAFYPVNWGKIRSLFRGARTKVESRWLEVKLDQIRKQSYGVHLWNKESRKLRVEEGSVISHVMQDSCIFCNSSGYSKFMNL